MNTPNKLTLLRVILVPFFILFLLMPSIPCNFLFATIVFIVASITDYIDGYLARKNNQITTFGKFLDPLADKVLVISALICFITLGLASPVAVVLIVAREFMVTSIRLVASSNNGTVIAASMSGKIKTVVQMIAIILPLVIISVFQVGNMEYTIPIEGISLVLTWISAVVTVISGITYLVDNKSLINTTK